MGLKWGVPPHGKKKKKMREIKNSTKLVVVSILFFITSLITENECAFICAVICGVGCVIAMEIEKVRACQEEEKNVKRRRN